MPVIVYDGVCCVHLRARMWSWSRTMSTASQLGVASGLVRLVFLTDATQACAYEQVLNRTYSLTTMTSIGTGYDLSASTYSPDGRIFQVRHHLKPPFLLRHVPSRSSTLTRPSRTRGMRLSVPFSDHTQNSCHSAPRSASESRTVSSLP